MSGTNIGDELNAAGLSWGWFQGGFRPTTTFADALAATGATRPADAHVHPGRVQEPSSTSANRPAHASQPGHLRHRHAGRRRARRRRGQYGYKDDYIPHHEPFQYYASTANPHHLPPASALAQHRQADTQTYVRRRAAVRHRQPPVRHERLRPARGGDHSATSCPPSALPAVSFLKAPGYQDGHAAYSDPLDEQAFVVNEINALKQTPDWSSTAVIVSYDDSDGWYDHAYQRRAPTRRSHGAPDAPVTGTRARAARDAARRPAGPLRLRPATAAAVISPWAKQNAVDHTLTDQSSIINFVEYNWHLPAIKGSFDQALQATDAKEGIPFDLAGLFDFTSCSASPLILDPATGRIDVRSTPEHGKNLRGVDWAGVEAAGVDLGGSNLQSAFVEDGDLSGADLQGANLNGADLRNVDLTGAVLRGANLSHADLTGAKLGHAVLTGANLNGDDLTNADLSGAVTTGANVGQVTWSNTVCPDGTNSDADGGTCKGHL